ncbi:hypothetical protein [Streptomyces sp. NBC_00576]|uniref:hypothetical protein n=1 Tax=Streptomyces sp. NBC_00576 TaxID=2903665 RepID=UPI002E822CF0|nr:hypothetical protein [Streptomyces sp. NBC_00576]WUB69319.1 hypothetical protein OG734_04020 [Streptomyces sp. NBC_00576]
MIEHARRKLAYLAPAFPEISIPLSSILQTGVCSVFLLTFRFSSALVVGVGIAGIAWPDALSLEVQLVLTAAAWSDRSGLAYVKVRSAR